MIVHADDPTRLPTGPVILALLAAAAAAFATAVVFRRQAASGRGRSA